MNKKAMYLKDRKERYKGGFGEKGRKEEMAILYYILFPI